jgi:hypothetical protein
MHFVSIAGTDDPLTFDTDAKYVTIGLSQYVLPLMGHARQALPPT